LRQAQGEAGALPRAGRDVERAAELAHFARDHVHPHAAAGQAADLVGGGETWLEDQCVEVAVAEHDAVADQAARLGPAPDRAAVQAGTDDAALQPPRRSPPPNRGP